MRRQPQLARMGADFDYWGGINMSVMNFPQGSERLAVEHAVDTYGCPVLLAFLQSKFIDLQARSLALALPLLGCK